MFSLTYYNGDRFNHPAPPVARVHPIAHNPKLERVIAKQVPSSVSRPPVEVPSLARKASVLAKMSDEEQQQCCRKLVAWLHQVGQSARQYTVDMHMQAAGSGGATADLQNKLKARGRASEKLMSAALILHIVCIMSVLL